MEEFTISGIYMLFAAGACTVDVVCKIFTYVHNPSIMMKLVQCISCSIPLPRCSILLDLWPAFSILLSLLIPHA